ncbi:uncharacterized protein LOC113306303 [Papaver somniferum]|uniref:uncharacterized protein LOC113306303 n=1 Tax=Papaver somniferum TaxID=3469 RepID=UPI000E6FDA71|nr:uncharacterized protein LOC113306303 [Papaver somniferum]
MVVGNFSREVIQNDKLAQEHASKISNITFSHVRRKDNRHADALAFISSMLRDISTIAVQIGRIYEPSIERPISGTKEALAVQTRAMREAEKEKKDEEVREPDNEAEESDKYQSMSDEDNEDEAWRIPIHQYLDRGTLPADVKEARKLESKAAMYSLRDGILYRRLFLGLLMRCLSRNDGRKILHDIHSGDADNHSGRRSLVVKAKMQG